MSTTVESSLASPDGGGARLGFLRHGAARHRRVRRRGRARHRGDPGQKSRYQEKTEARVALPIRSSRSSAIRRCGRLEHVTTKSRLERESLIAEQDAFIVSLTEDHQRDLAKLEQQLARSPHRPRSASGAVGSAELSRCASRARPTPACSKPPSASINSRPNSRLLTERSTRVSKRTSGSTASATMPSRPSRSSVSTSTTRSTWLETKSRASSSKWRRPTASSTTPATGRAKSSADCSKSSKPAKRELDERRERCETCWNVPKNRRHRRACRSHASQ